MKKFVSLILALVLVFSLTISAGATTLNPGSEPDGTASWQDGQNVTVTVSGGAGMAKVYYVVVTWTDMAFTYHIDNADTWDPVEHEYQDDGLSVGWTGSTEAVIKVDNHSNEAVQVDAKFENDGYTSDAKDGVTMQMYTNDGTTQIEDKQTIGEADAGDSLTLGTKEERFAAAPSFTYKVKPSGTPTVAGTLTYPITVTITTPTP